MSPVTTLMLPGAIGCCVCCAIGAVAWWWSAMIDSCSMPWAASSSCRPWAFRCMAATTMPIASNATLTSRPRLLRGNRRVWPAAVSVGVCKKTTTTCSAMPHAHVNRPRPPTSTVLPRRAGKAQQRRSSAACVAPIMRAKTNSTPRCARLTSAWRMRRPHCSHYQARRSPMAARYWCWSRRNCPGSIPWRPSAT